MDNVSHYLFIHKRYLPVILFLFCSQIIVGQSGKLSGKITDAGTGEALIGANVIVEGTTTGAATDVDGYYSVLNLRPGTYTVRYQYIGYNTQVVSNVKISADKTTTQSVQLTSSAIISETVVVVADKPVVEFNQTSSVKTVTSDEMQSLPVQSLNDIINLQAGVCVQRRTISYPRRKRWVRYNSRLRV